MKFLLVLHIAVAVFLIGPLTFATSVTPRLIRQGEKSFATLQLMHRTTQIYGLGTLLGGGPGAGLVRAGRRTPG